MRATALRSLDVADAVARAKGAPTLAPPTTFRLAPPANDRNADPAVAWLRREGLGATGSAELWAALEIGKTQWMALFDLMIEFNSAMARCLLNLKHEPRRDRCSRVRQCDAEASNVGLARPTCQIELDRLVR